MRRKKILSHAHKFKRAKFSNGETIYFCVSETCEFRCRVELALGKPAVCWRCGEKFLMNEYSIRLMKPHCNNCTKGKTGKEITTDDLNLSLSGPVSPEPNQKKF